MGRLSPWHARRRPYGRGQVGKLSSASPSCPCGPGGSVRVGVRKDAEPDLLPLASHRAGNLAAMLTAIHTMAAMTTSAAVSGRDACRSTLDSHRLM
jgi:hypothetical protein